jgi:hypothetical protein
MLSFETELHVAFNVAALLLNARDTNRFVKEQSVGTILTTGQKLALFYKQIIAMIFDKPKRMEFLSCSISIAPLCGMLDELPGDPHLVSIFRSCLRESKDLMRTVALLDLLLCCGENEHERILLELKKANHLGLHSPCIGVLRRCIFSASTATWIALRSGSC